MTDPDASRAFQVSLLGGLEVLTRTGRPVVFPARKAEALLAVLARHPGRRQDRERLTGLLWPDSAPDAARTSLRQALKQLRRAFAADDGQIVLTEGDALAINGDLIDVDVARLEHASRAAEHPDLAELARVYRGDFLEGFASVEDPFDEWVTLQRMQLREQVADALSTHFIGDDHRPQARHVVQLAVRLLALDPLREDLHRLLMRFYLDDGRRAAALAQYRSCCTVLKQELDVEPEPATQALHQEIREVPPRTAITSSLQPEAHTETGIEAVVARPALAVLPFVNLDGDEDRDYFADGLSEDVITALAGWRRFPLIASSSTLTYRKAPVDPHRLGEELGARYLVAGSIRRQGGQARINVRLIDADDGRILWTRRYDVEPGDILAAQDESAGRIAAAIQPQLEHAELRRIVTKRTADLNAWDYFLRGVSLLNRFTAEDHDHARSYFERAIEIDPDYGDAYTGLADTHLFDIVIQQRQAAGSGQVNESQLRHAFEAARAAVALDPDSSAAWRSLGHAHVWAREFEAAITETEKAVELNPSNADARRALGNRLDLVGRTPEGIKQMEWALQLSPRDPRRWVQLGFITRAHLDAGHYDEALSWARQAVHLRPDQPETHFRLAVCLAHLGRRKQAEAAIAECERLRKGFIAEKSAWRPYSDPARNEHFFHGLRRLGLMTP